MSKNKLLKFLTLFLVILTVGHFIWQIYVYRTDILKKFDAAYWTMRYNQSQWVVPNSKNSVGDDGLYMYAGYRYVKGDDPTLLNAEYPPLGKYIVGLFEVATGYMNIFSLFFGCVVLVLFYILNKQIFKSSLVAMMPVTFFSLEPLFTSQIRAAYLDTLYLTALLLGFIFVLRKKYILAGVAFGAFMSIKAPFLVVVLYGAVILFLWLQKELKIKKASVMIASSLIVFILSYSATFLHGHSIVYFLQVQKYIIHFYSSGAKGVFGAVIPMIFAGNWYTWFGGVQRVGEWSIGWPIVTFGSLVAVGIWFKNKDPKVLFLLLWSGFYLAFLVITPIYARYLLLLLPFLYNLSIWSLSVVIKSRFS